ncbi:MAG: ABC transporter ATP-binding protein/permease [Clostridia bacterium]|nr:ABC transporter ATP-binding protein/permease [Clostridia bacterium]
MGVIIRYYMRYWLWILLALGFLVCEALCELELPSYMSQIITEGIMTVNIKQVLRVGGIMLGMSLAACASSIIVSFLASRVGSMISRDIRNDLFDKVTSFSSAEYNKFSVSSLITRSTNDITQIQIFTIMLLRMVMFSPIMGIGGVIKAVRASSGISALGIVIAVALAAVIVGIVILLIAVQPKFIKMQKQIDGVNRIAREGLSGMMVIRAFNTVGHEEERFDKANKELTATNLFVNRVMALLMPLITIVMNGVSIATVWVASYFADNYVQVAEMMAFMQYAIHIVMSFMMISMVFILLPRAAVSMRRVAEVLNTDVSIVNKEGKESPTGIRFKGDIVFNDVSFNYGGSENAIEHISFEAHKGETTAIIGSTGSGKSTVINLIPRLADVSDGSITIDGVDIRDYNLEDLRRNIGFVPQKNTLFSGTIASNLRLGDEDADAAALEQAADIAQAKDFIDSKPDRYNEPIAQGGSNVSGGQKQRLAIARALVKRAPIYVFDDSFSALDFKTDAQLRKSLGENMSDSTLIIVAQRVGTIMGADRIIVLDEGKIVGMGTHEELLNSCEVYRAIAVSQLSEEELA